MRTVKLLTLFLMFLGLMLTGCTKQETDENLRNIGSGFKNIWGDVKEGTAETAKEFNEATQ